MDDANNIIVLGIFAASVVAVIAGYLLAWRSNKKSVRVAGSLLVGVVAGFAGLFMTIWLIGTALPYLPSQGDTVWDVLLPILVLSPIPISALYLSVRFISRARRLARS